MGNRQRWRFDSIDGRKRPATGGYCMGYYRIGGRVYRFKIARKKIIFLNISLKINKKSFSPEKLFCMPAVGVIHSYFAARSQYISVVEGVYIPNVITAIKPSKKL